MFKGQFIDAVTKESIPGVIILVNDVPKAAADVNGYFAIDVKSGDKAKAKMVGYELKPFGGKTTGEAVIELFPVAHELSAVEIIAKGGKPWYKKPGALLAITAGILILGYVGWKAYKNQPAAAAAPAVAPAIPVV